MLRCKAGGINCSQDPAWGKGWVCGRMTSRGTAGWWWARLRAGALGPLLGWGLFSPNTRCEFGDRESWGQLLRVWPALQTLSPAQAHICLCVRAPSHRGRGRRPDPMLVPPALHWVPAMHQGCCLLLSTRSSRHQVPRVLPIGTGWKTHDLWFLSSASHRAGEETGQQLGPNLLVSHTPHNPPS